MTERGPRRGPRKGSGPRKGGKPGGGRPGKGRSGPPAPRRPWKPHRIFLASRNPGKLQELEALLEETPYHVISGERMIRLPSPVEDGVSFTANARKKALHYSRLVRDLVLADDSGLEVDALDGRPGVRSARICGGSATDEDRLRWILSQLERTPWEERTARFRCVIAIAQGGEVLADFEGAVAGRIAFEPEGSAGFGYDPIFYYPPMDMTFAEMSAAEKDHVSHRGQALRKAVDWLLERATRRNA